MDESRNPSDSRDLARTTLPPKIIHYPTSRTYTTPDLAPPVIKVNRSPRSPRRGHGPGNDVTLNNAVPRADQSQSAAWQQHSPSIDNHVRRSNIDNRLWNLGGVQDNAMATPIPVVDDGGLGRSPPAARPNTGLPSSRVRKWVFVMEDEAKSTQPSKRVLTDDEKRQKQQLRKELEEKGGACLRCSQERKACDREDICLKCRLPRPGANPTDEATLCLRGIEKLWLWRAVEQHSLHGGSRKQALHEARDTTFADSRRPLKELQALLGNHMSLVVYLTSKLGDSTATSPIVAVSGSLAENLQSSPNNLTRQVKEALATHLPDLVLRSPPNVSTADQRKLMVSVQSALRVFRFFSNAAHIMYHVSPSDMKSAPQVGYFLMESCTRLLATEVEEVLEQIRAMIWPRNPSDVPKHAFGLYYRILEGLQRSNAQNARDDVLNPLRSRASEVIPDLSLLYRNIYGSRETLQDFVDREIPSMADIHNLHLGHELLSTIHNPAKSWKPMPDPFHKDCLVHDFLRPGQVSWTPELHPVQSRVLNPQPILATHTSPLRRGRSGAYELISSENSYESPDATLRNSWDDRSTCIQSPTEAEHGAELRRGNNVQVGDVKSPQDLLGITGETGTHHKRGRSLASPQCTSPSPPFKQSKLDAGQTCLSVPEHQADDADITTEADETSGPQPWDPGWESFFDLAFELA